MWAPWQFELIVDKMASYISGLNPGWGIVIFIALLFAASFVSRFIRHE